jgi:hypothetical protein
VISADDVWSISADEVRSDLTHSEIEALPTFDEHATNDLVSVGWLQKHLGSQKDAKSDEEPG